MIGTPVSSPASSPTRPPRVETPVHRSSRRLQGLRPEFGLLQGPPLPTATPAQEMAFSRSPTQVTVQNLRIPEPFHGRPNEDAEDWLEEFERVAKSNHWSPDEKLFHVYFALEDGAKTWFINREATLTTWDEFCRRLRDTFGNTDRRENAQRLLESRIQQLHEGVAMFAEDMVRLFHRADPNMSEAKKLSHLMRGVREQLFVGLVRNPPTTVDEFIREATAIERALQQRYHQCDRRATGAPAGAAALTATDECSLRLLIRQIVREEIAKENARCTSPSQSPQQQEFTVASVAEVVRQELRQAFASPEQYPDASYQPNAYTYGDAVRRPLAPEPSYQPDAYSYADAVRRPLPMPAPQYRQPPPVAAWAQQDPIRRPQLRKTDIWRTADRRPLCYNCGEPGHIYRFCPHRPAGYRGSAPAATRRQFCESRAPIDDDLAGRQESSATFRTRSPSPARFASPSRRSFADAVRGRSPSPRRGN